jgi:hypothetical protein
VFDKKIPRNIALVSNLYLINVGSIKNTVGKGNSLTRGSGPTASPPSVGAVGAGTACSGMGSMAEANGARGDACGDGCRLPVSVSSEDMVKVKGGCFSTGRTGRVVDDKMGRPVLLLVMLLLLLAVILLLAVLLVMLVVAVVGIGGCAVVKVSGETEPSGRGGEMWFASVELRRAVVGSCGSEGWYCAWDEQQMERKKTADLS